MSFFKYLKFLTGIVVTLVGVFLVGASIIGAVQNRANIPTPNIIGLCVLGFIGFVIFIGGIILVLK